MTLRFCDQVLKIKDRIDFLGKKDYYPVKEFHSNSSSGACSEEN
jgi:hypothetical protein